MHSDTDVTARALARITASKARADEATAETPNAANHTWYDEDDDCWHVGSFDEWAVAQCVSEARARYLVATRPAVAMPLLDIAAAAVRLVAADSYWWLGGDEDTYRCRACDGAGHLPVSVGHAPDCAAMQLDAAIRAAGEAGQ